jgi:membrane associated rhomboid family serine protease
MRYARYPPSSSFFHEYFPPGVKWLLIVNTAVFLLTGLLPQSFEADIALLALAPVAVVFHLAFWQLATYLFLHGSIWHLLFNMLTLWMFGVQLEQDWGTRKFLKYYFLCGIGAGLCDVALHAAMGDWSTRTIGASGAIFGLLLAFGVLYPNQMVLMNFLFPIKAKYMVMIYGAIELWMSTTSAINNAFIGPNTGVSSIAHLGGMLFGYLYLKGPRLALRMPDAAGAYRQWKLRRAKRKFQVYMRKQGGRGPWVN